MDEVRLNILKSQLNTLSQIDPIKANQLRKSIQDELNKGGEGSRGGKVIGHTKSGKPIYDSFGHEGHKDFSKEDHKDASDKHMEVMRNRSTNHTGTYHDEESASHFRASKEKEGDKKLNFDKPVKFVNPGKGEENLTYKIKNFNEVTGRVVIEPTNLNLKPGSIIPTELVSIKDIKNI